MIPEKDLNQIFNHLYKGENGNFGLGLTISQKIVHYYQGKVQVEIKRIMFALQFFSQNTNIIGKEFFRK